MIKHIAAFRLEGQTPEQEEAMLAAVRGLQGKIPELKNFTVGRNISPRDPSMTHCLVMEFDDMDAMMRYVDHPLHVEVVEQHIAPYRKARMIADYEF